MRCENDAIYKNDCNSLRGPLPPVIHGVPSPERQRRRQMINDSWVAFWARRARQVELCMTDEESARKCCGKNWQCQTDRGTEFCG